MSEILFLSEKYFSCNMLNCFSLGCVKQGGQKILFLFESVRSLQAVTGKVQPLETCAPSSQPARDLKLVEKTRYWISKKFHKGLSVNPL